MFAYRIPDLEPSEGHAGLAAHPIAKRLAHVGKWQLVAHPMGGAFATWAGKPSFPAAYGEPRQTHDGLEFYPPKEWPTDRALFLREKLPEHEAVDLVGGRVLVGVAMRAARKRRFSVPGVGRPSGALADAAFELWDKINESHDVMIDDPLLTRVLFLAVAACYRVTEEAMDDLGWLTTEDDNAVTSVVFGLHPKPDAGAGDTSASSAPASNAHS